MIKNQTEMKKAYNIVDILGESAKVLNGRGRCFIFRLLGQFCKDRNIRHILIILIKKISCLYS